MQHYDHKPGPTCDNCGLIESSWWHEEPGYGDEGAYYWCSDCVPTDAITEAVAETIVNAQGATVELVSYCCDEDCSDPDEEHCGICH